MNSKSELEIFKKFEITSSQILQNKLQDKQQENSMSESVLLTPIEQTNQQFNFEDVDQQMVDSMISQSMSNSLSPLKITKSNSIEELAQKLNEYIDQYILELKQPSGQFLETLSLHNSEIFEDETNHQQFDITNIRQKIFQKIKGQLNLSVIQSISTDQSNNNQTPLIEIPELRQLVTLTSSTPTTPARSTEEIKFDQFTKSTKREDKIMKYTQ